MFINIVAGKKKLGQKRAQFPGRCTGRRHPSQFHDDLVAIVKVIQLLRVVTNLDLCTPLNFTRQRGDFRENRFKEGSLAGSVWADNSETFTPAQDKRDIPGKELVWITDCRMVHGQNMIPGPLD